MAADILAELLADGLTLTADHGRLIVEPAGSITDEHRALIRAHKGELLDLLRNGATLATECGTCGTCRHVRRPGLADGYCIARADLPPAYGTDHPLRKLPALGGVDCGDWEGWK